MLKPHSLLTLSLLLIPSALLLSHNQDMPQFGDVHDDSLYYVSAKSIAEGSYKIESLPGRPWQTKYPPLYPLLLSLAWKIEPKFPDNLTIAAWLSWLAFPALLVQLAMYFPRLGLSPGRCWILLCIVAFNPYFLLFGVSLLSDLPFAAALITSFLLLESGREKQNPLPWIAAAGVAGGLAFLLRSAGLVLLASAPLYLWIKRERKSAYAFVAAMLPFVAGWMLWGRLNGLHTNDPNLIYYTDYLRYQVINYEPKSIPLFLWKNIDELLYGLGSIMLPKITSSMFLKMIAWVIAVAMISGIVRMLKRGFGLHYALYAAGSIALLMIWHFPANERYILSIVPLALAGLLTEMEHFWEMTRAGLKHKQRDQRIAARVMLTIVPTGIAAMLALQVYVDVKFLPSSIQNHRQANVDHRGAYAWIKANVPQDATLLAYNDPVLHLYTGRHAMSRILSPALWYLEKHDEMTDLYKNIVPWAKEHGIDYVYFTTADLRRDWGDEDREAVEKSIASNPGLIPVYRHGISTVYRVAP